ncbi:MAG: acyltransferase [Alteromonadaceae bacterium]|nr:MAG: acyltransferase [Alteromonadaceae bacterium]
MESRERWVDYAKAIGILLVVYGHVARGLFNAGIDMPLETYHLVESIIYTFHMPLFFFLSGLFFYASFLKYGARKFIFRKIDVVVYPYLLWSIFQGLVEAYLSSYTNYIITYSEVFSLLWFPRAHFWFLYALFSVFVFASLIFTFTAKKYVLPVFLASIALYMFSRMLPSWVLFDFISDNFVFFMLGIVFSLYAWAERMSSKPLLCAIFVAFVVGQAVFHGYFGLNFEYRGFGSLFLASISILTVVSLSMLFDPKRARLLAFVGSSSMGIYLMHVLAGSGIRVVLKSFLGVESYIVHLILGCGVGIFAPIIALLIIQRFKIPYILSAPIYAWGQALYDKMFAGRPRSSS